MQLVPSCIPNLPRSNTGQRSKSRVQVPWGGRRCGPLHVPFTCQSKIVRFFALPQVLDLLTTNPSYPGYELCAEWFLSLFRRLDDHHGRRFWLAFVVTWE